VWNDVARAAMVDVDVWRAVTRVFHVLDRIDDVLTPRLLTRIRELRDSAALPIPPAGPTPDEVRAVLAVPVPA
jgi:hypothetical protein